MSSSSNKPKISTRQGTDTQPRPYRYNAAVTDAELREAAERQLRANLRRGVSSLNGRPYSFCVPSNITYPFQWFWDSCFHAIVWSHIDIEQAKEELRTLLRAQRKSGRIPHRIAWEKMRVYPYRFYLHSTSLRQPTASRLVQPPLLAQAIEAVYGRSGDREFVEQMLPGTERLYRWLAANRDPDGDILVSIIHPSTAYSAFASRLRWAAQPRCAH